MEGLKITIIGAGVVGLAVAWETAGDYQDIFVIERNSSFGQETSSRNSEVIHAGIHYPKDSLKSITCREGKLLLYEFCQKYQIPHQRIGKLIVAINQQENLDLENLFKNGLESGVDDLRLLEQAELEQMEPNVTAERAIYSPSTGILDTYKFMQRLLSEFKSQGGQIVYNTEVIRIDKLKNGYQVTVQDKQEGVFSFFTQVLINCAGLNSDKIARMAGIQKEDYCLKYCKGDYFRVSQSKSKLIHRLIYPVPKKKETGLGIHATPDLTGSLRLGPDDEYVEKINYEVNPLKQKLFYAATRLFLPFITLEDLTPDTSGIRPKLHGQKEEFRDFLIRDESESSLPGFINLIGIESPGLTSSLAIAKLVKQIIQKYL